MKPYFAYIRVSTVRQGEKGSSLQEQRSAIEAYAQRQGLSICQWFEEQETAAKLGRPIFTQMLRALDKGQAAGVVTHKIDRSARNLKDWATLGDLLDRGIELHFAHESIDLSSRGGRLSADIQAVVAADFIRNLRDEVRKGFYGRLKQGLYPMRAPIGYLDQGRGLPKEIDPLKGPLITAAFDLYASGHYSLDSLAGAMHARGLRNLAGAPVSRNGWSTILNNPFYLGLMRIKRTGEVFQGVHGPIVSKSVFDAVQSILTGRHTYKVPTRRFRYQRAIRCGSCARALIGERQKGQVYYRCHNRNCPTTSLREAIIDEAVRVSVRPFAMTESEWREVRDDLDVVLQYREGDAERDIRATKLHIAAIDDRMTRLTDAYVDRLIEQDLYLSRKEKLLHDRAGLTARKVELEAGKSTIADRAVQMLELIKTLGTQGFWESDDKIREMLKLTTSNFTASGKTVAIAWRSPFSDLANLPLVNSGEPSRDKARTEVMFEKIVECFSKQKEKRDPGWSRDQKPVLGNGQIGNPSL